MVGISCQRCTVVLWNKIYFERKMILKQQYCEEEYFPRKVL